MSKGLTPKAHEFVKQLSMGKGKRDAAILAGYSPHSAHVQASNLLKNQKVIKALDDIGLSENKLARLLKKNIQAGLGIKATADTSLRGIELAYKLRGNLDNRETNNLTQNNYIISLKQLDDNQLQERLIELTETTKQLQDNNV